MSETSKRCIVIIDERGKIQEIPLKNESTERYRWGRDVGQNEIVTNSAVISRTHGKFKVTPDALLYADLGSTNGTYAECGGTKTFIHASKSYTILKSGDMLRVQSPKGDREGSVLVLYSEDGQKGKWNFCPIGGTNLNIGRGHENDIVLHHPGVSRKHAIIERQGIGMIL